MPVTDITKDIDARTLTITAEFAAPVERVWALYADPRKRKQMGVAARNRAVTCFSVPAMVAGYRGLLHGGDLS